VTHQVDFEPIGRRHACPKDTTLLEAARQAGVGIVSICGGRGTCGHCRVRILDGLVSPPTEAEGKVFSAEELAAGWRLACQVEILSDLRVHVPPTSLTTPQRIQVEGQELAVPLQPAVQSYKVELPPRASHDLRPDLTRLRDVLAREHGLERLTIDSRLLPCIPLRLREWNGMANVVVRDGELIDLLPEGRLPLGLAVDLGTTKIAAHLLDLRTGETLEARGVMNPQIACGEDVIARIAHAMEGEDQAEELRQAAVGAVNDVAGELCALVGRSRQEIAEAVVVGNTAMHHLFLGLPVSQLGLAPYLAAVIDPLDFKAREVGLEIAAGGYVHLLPNIAGFVGADHVAMLLSTGIYRAEETIVGLDIGTNTEVALRTGKRLFACSTASGPAFEGAHIRDGMRAAPGAIERLRITDTHHVEYQTIDGAPPVGLCGSGILDAVAQLLEAGVLDERGSMGEHHPRVRQGKNGPEFVLVAQGEGGDGREVVITRADVGEIQLAKGAMRAGINVLLDEAGLSTEEIDKIVIAGAFGTYVDVGSAVAVGMVPPLPLSRFVQVGNAAAIGAKLALISTKQRALAEEIARQVEYIELTNDRRFVRQFTEAMFLR
jgi:uncharacterized 2Fe-2S/4Fe-4S cluster protein (DUF4445 family)